MYGRPWARFANLYTAPEAFGFSSMLDVPKSHEQWSPIRSEEGCEQAGDTCNTNASP